MPSLELLMQREQQLCDQAHSVLHRAQDMARHAGTQRDQLVAHRAEYEARWAAQFQQGAPMTILVCYRSFMQRLDQAVTVQTRQVELAERQVAQARRELLECERRVASVRKLLERRLAELAQAGRQREQKHSDEQAQRMRWQPSQRDRLLPQ